jgi:hypothetical protein
MFNLSTPTQIGKQYSFVIIADPQLGSDRDYYGDWKNHPNLNYRMYYQTIKKVNAIKPAFVVINGDLVGNFQIPSQYRNFVRMTQLFQVPVVLVYGNHDGYPFTQFFNAQQAISGQQSLYYSFDVGKWHYIALPTIPNGYNPEPLLNWLTNDLQANQAKPTVLFSHYHYLPQGLTQLEYYAQNPIDLRIRILDEVLKYGNVKYWYTGHVHNGIKTSVKTAWNYRGCQFITVPTTVLSRNFGEEYPTFKRGLKQGGYFMTIDVNDEAVTLKGQRAGQNQVFIYPKRFRKFQPQIEPRWLENVPNFVPHPFTNGGFEKRLQGWYRVWRYKADQQPGYITRSSQKRSTAGSHSLELAVREKGQHWSNVELTEAYQVVDVPPGKAPLLQLNYYADQISAMGGGYIRLHAYRGATHQFTMIFEFGRKLKNTLTLNTGKIFALTATGQDSSLLQLIDTKQVMFWRLHQRGQKWHHLEVDIKKLYRDAFRSIGQPRSFQVDKLFLGLGAWNGKIPGSKTKVFFDQVKLNWRNTASASKNDQSTLPVGSDVFQTSSVLSTPGKQEKRSLVSLVQRDSDMAQPQFDRLTGNRTSGSIVNPDAVNSEIVTGMNPEINAAMNPGIDPLMRPSDADTFVLDSSAVADYDDGNVSLGHTPFALIANFSQDTDKTVVSASLTDDQLAVDYFRFGASTVTDTQIFQMGGRGALHSLIASIQDVSPCSVHDCKGLG